MIIVTGVVGDEVDCGELRIRDDKVFGKSILSQHGTVHARWSGRQGGIKIARVIQRVQGGGGRLVIPLSKVGIKTATRAQSRSSREATLSNRSRSEVYPVKDLIQQSR